MSNVIRLTSAQQVFKDKLMRESGVPIRYKKARLRDLKIYDKKQKPVYERCAQFLKNKEYEDGTQLAFIGTKGTGKTHVASAFVNHLILTGDYGEYSKNIPKFTTVVRLLREIRDTFGNASKKTETEVIDQFLLHDLLVIDEIGAQTDSEFNDVYLFEILRDRAANRKATILISNLGINEFEDFVTDLIVDRIKEDGGEILIFKWDSHRGKE